MKAYKKESDGIVLADIPKPEGELIEIKAIGVNRADVFCTQGKYPVLGLEFAGLLNGKRVAGIIDGGAYSEFISADKATYYEMPEELSFEDAAAITESLFTAYYNLVELCGLKKGEKILIHGGASGVGVVAIQLAKMIGAEVFATSGKPEKLALISNLGAKALDYNTEDFTVNKYDVILDMVGGDYFNGNISALNYGGRLAIIALIGGAKIEANVAPILLNNLSVYGSTIRSLDPGKKTELCEKINPYLTEIKAVIDKVYSFGQAAMAIDYVAEYKNAGKVILRMDR